MQNPEQVKQHFNDLASQLTAGVENIDGRKSGKLDEYAASKAGKRIQWYERAEEICMSQYPDVQQCLTMDLNADLTACKGLLKALQKCVTEQRDKMKKESV